MYIYLSQKWGDLNFQGQFFKKVYFFVQGMCPMILGTVISQCWESSKDTKCHSEVFPREKKFLAMICHSAAILELYTVGTTLLWPLLVQCCHEFYCENSQALILLTLIPSSVHQFEILPLCFRYPKFCRSLRRKSRSSRRRFRNNFSVSFQYRRNYFGE